MSPKIIEFPHDDPTPIEEAIAGVLGHRDFAFVVLERLDGVTTMHTPSNEDVVAALKALARS